MAAKQQKLEAEGSLLLAAGIVKRWRENKDSVSKQEIQLVVSILKAEIHAIAKEATAAGMHVWL